MYHIPTHIAELIAQFAATPTRLAQAVAGKTPEQLQQRTSPTAWSAQDILVHMRAADEIVASRVYMILARDISPLTAFDERRWAEIAGYTQVAFDQSLTLFTLRRAEFVAVLHHLPVEAWQRCGQHEVHGEQSLLAIVQNMAAHEDEHCTQLETLWTR